MSRLLSVQCFCAKRNIRVLWRAAPHNCQRPISLSVQQEGVIKDNSLSSCIGKTRHLSPVSPVPSAHRASAPSKGRAIENTGPFPTVHCRSQGNKALELGLEMQMCLR